MPKLQKENLCKEENVINERIDHLIEHRIPWLIIGLLGGLLVTLIVSNFESILAADVRLAFFIPVIIYLSGAVGTQTETIYVRFLSKEKVHFWKYISKESVIGLGLGLISGLFLGIFAAYWLNSLGIGLVIGLTMFINLTLAPILAVLVTNLLYKRKTDPALGAGPVVTIILDLISLLVYFFITSLILF